MISRFYFLCYEVDAPIKIRHQRFLNKYKKQQSLTLEDFIELDDKIKFNDDEFSVHTGAADQQTFIKKRFQNKTENLMDFHRCLRSHKFNDKQLVRPSFDTYFLRLAEVAASRSNCMKSGIGAVIAKEQRVVSTGYNGTPCGLTNCNQGGCPRCNKNISQGKELDKCLCLHAEESAIIEAGRPRTIGATLYTTHFPC